MDAWRMDWQLGDVSTVTTLLVSYSGRSAYMYSANNSLCTSYCLPLGARASLPPLRIQPSDMKGTTICLGCQMGSSQQWQRVQPGPQYNTTVLYTVQLSIGPSPVLSNTFATYTAFDQVLSTRTCSLISTSYHEDANPLLFTPPPSCAHSHTRPCYGGAQWPYSVADGCYLAEVLDIIGTGATSCSCT
jgi:hypothetical protein